VNDRDEENPAEQHGAGSPKRHQAAASLLNYTQSLDNVDLMLRRRSSDCSLHERISERLENKSLIARENELSERLLEEPQEVDEEKAPLIDNFDEKFVDRVAEPVGEGEGETCGVCCYEYSDSDFFSLKCGHRFCVNCQADHLRTKITNGMAMKLPCMQQGCKERYSPDEIQQFCSAKIQKQYQVIKEDVRVGKSRKLKWCARPGCETVITRPGCCCKRRAICSTCNFATCFKCGDPYHEAAC